MVAGEGLEKGLEDGLALLGPVSQAEGCVQGSEAWASFPLWVHVTHRLAAAFFIVVVMLRHSSKRCAGWMEVRWGQQWGGGKVEAPVKDLPPALVPSGGARWRSIDGG